MPQIDTYTAGTVALTNGSAVVTGTNTNWTNAGAFSVVAGHWFRVGTFVALIVSVDSATQLTLAQPFTGTTASGLAYQIYRYTRLETPEAVGLLQNVLTRGSSANPFTRLDVDSGAMRASWRDDGAGNPALFVGATGAADGAMVEAIELDKVTGAARFRPGTAALPGLTPIGDPDTGIVSPAANRWGVATAGVLRWLVDENGNVGIGTASPSSLYGQEVRLALNRNDDALTILGINSAPQGANAGASVRMFTGTGNSFYYQTLYDLNGSPVLAIDVGSGVACIDWNFGGVHRARLEASGNLGLGTGSPGANLHIRDSDPAKVWADNSADVVYIDGGVSGINLVTTTTGFLAFSDAATRSIGLIEYLHLSNDMAFRAAGAEKLRLLAGGTVRPGADNTQPFGSASFRWSEIFAGTGTINTSDATLKAERGDLTPAELRAWGAVRPLVYQWLDAVAAKGGDAARLHAGYLAQQVEAAFAAEGLDVSRYALFCRDPITRKATRTETRRVQATEQREEVATEVEIRDGAPVRVTKTRVVEVPLTEPRVLTDEAGKIIVDERGVPMTHPVPVMIEEEIEVEFDEPAGERLGLRYDQCLVFETAYLRSRLADHEARIAALEAAKT